MRSALGIADLLHAWQAVARDPAALAPLGRVFGLGATEAAPAPVPEPTGTVATPMAPLPVAPSAPAPIRSAGLAAREPANASRSRSNERLVVTELTEFSDRPPDLPVWLTADPLPPPSPPVWVAPAPLFAPTRERALLAAAARTLRAVGVVDSERLIEHLARRAELRVLPRRRILSLAGGVQIVLDLSPWMAPFAEDVAAIVARCRLVAGDAVDELTIAELPPHVQRPDEPEPQAWTPPPPGTAIIIVTDLGRSAARRGERAPSAAWQAFLRDVVSAGFAVIAVVPGRCQAKRHAGVPRRALVLGWDRQTRVAEATRFRKLHVR